MYKKYKADQIVFKDDGVSENDQKRFAQEQYCADNNLPRFAPMDGICFSCYRNIYDAITLKRASTTLITGCPYCNRSFCS